MQVRVALPALPCADRGSEPAAPTVTGTVAAARLEQGGLNKAPPARGKSSRAVLGGGDGRHGGGASPAGDSDSSGGTKNESSNGPGLSVM